MIFSSNINFIDSKNVPYLNTYTNTDKNTGFANYLSACVSLANPDAANGVYENTTKDDKIGDWKYLSVRAGQKVYTYVLIGKHFKILIGVDNAEKEEEVDGQDKKTTDETVDGKFADNVKETGGFGKVDDFSDLSNPSSEKQNKFEKQMLNPCFITDTRMFALTGHYKETIREIMRKMQENLGDVKTANNKENIETEEKKLKR